PQTPEDRRHIRAGRRAGPHAARRSSRPARQADPVAAPLSSAGSDVGILAELLRGVARRILYDSEEGTTRLVDRSRVWTSGADQPARAEPDDSRALPDPSLSRYHPQPALPVTCTRL